MSINENPPQNQPSLTDPNEMKELTAEEIKKHREKQPPKMAEVKRYKAIAGMMMGDKSKKFPPFPQKFHVIRDRKGAKSYVEEGPGQVVFDVNPDRIIDCITNYSDQIEDDLYAMKNDQAIKCFKRWASMYPPFDDSKISPVRQKSTPGYCWHRLPFDLADGPTPLFGELMGRASNSDALMAWIGSLFIEQSERQQYVWLYGEGENGKGALARFLGKCLENTTAEEDVPIANKRDKPSQFWTDALVGKRLVVFDDCEAYYFPSSAFFKKLTGGNAVRREIKNGAVVYVNLQCKFLFTSNDKPELSGSRADRRRAIFCAFADIPDEAKVPRYEQRLWEDEAAHFLYKCVAMYKGKVDEYGKIESNKDELDELITASQSRYEAFVEEGLAVIPGLPHDQCCSAVDMQQLFKAHGIYSNHEQKLYKDYIAREHGIKLIRMRTKDGRKNIYTNCTRKLYLDKKELQCPHCKGSFDPYRQTKANT